MEKKYTEFQMGNNSRNCNVCIDLADILQVSFSGYSKMPDLALACELLHNPTPSLLALTPLRIH